MDSFETTAIAAAPISVIRAERAPRIWKFWGTALWGLFIFAAMFVGQIAVVAWFVLRREGPIDLAAATQVVGGGLTISLSVIMGLPAVLAALWLAIRVSRTPFADYLALRWTSWRNVLIGVVRARLSLPRLVGIVPAGSGRHSAVVDSVDRTAPAIRLVLSRRSVFDRPSARLSPLSNPFDLADDRPARPQQSCRDAADDLAGGVWIEELVTSPSLRGATR